MGKAKDILLRPIPAAQANELVKRVHYSGKIVQNSQIHIGVFYDGRLEGAMQFGPSLDKRKIQGLVSGTAWHEFIELNRMAFSEALPRNSESRAIAIAMRLLKKHAPQIKWVISFADGTQCGDGTIYRASGFVLTGIVESKKLFLLPSGEVVHLVTLESNPNTPLPELGGRTYFQVTNGRFNPRDYLIAANAKRTSGFQLRYIYFIDPTYRQRLTVPELPFSEIERMGARMYKGQREQAAGAADVAPDDQSGEGGLIPTPPLHTEATR